VSRDEAEGYVRACAEDEGPESYEDAAKIFAAIFGRDPDPEDGDAGDLWSHACAAVDDPTLRAEVRHDTWTVVDPAGGRWWPNARVSAELAAAEDPAAEVVRICTETPLRGRWAQ